MRFCAFFCAVALAAAFAGPAAAQSEAKPDAVQGGVPTATIINKAPEVSKSAPPTLEVTPQTAERPAAPAPEAPVVSGASAANKVPVAVAAPAPAEPADAAKAAPSPEPRLAIDIDLSRQEMTVSEDGVSRYTWPISSARYGYRTPTGTYQPTWMAKMWYSRQYDYAPMPHAIFFHQGVAIHATYATRGLGRPASHGCVRLAPRNASTLYRLVSRHGKERTQIVVHGTPHHSDAEVAYDEPRGGRDEPQRFRRGVPAYRYLPPSYYARGYSAYGPPPVYGYARPRIRRAYAAPRRAPRGLYSGYSYGYGF